MNNQLIVLLKYLKIYGMIILFHKMIVLLLLVSYVLVNLGGILYSSLVLANTLNALKFNGDNERNFNERLLVSLGFVKVKIKKNEILFDDNIYLLLG